ncbi:PPK2 family polyphosphate:nucleotide phosphotransferase [Microterricola gilva]|uniref:PPK2 family polyphosphate:nucleotide phosphotransferase n=1 Tax=Microterricola gilva TaxID=393267 RepID=A0A4Q8ARE6_9MICO|nr:polyphosphate kinase 2 family protein [Microterricola gilva]RZU66675.1 PPK2 family polyphosphate:nucleotide phosphotransferase [Microterricola gilva]
MGHAAPGIWDADPSEGLRVRPGFVLADVDTDSTPGYSGDKKTAVGHLAAGAAELDRLQEMLFANSRLGDNRKILLVLQAMDTAGKGGILRHVVGSVDPQGVEIAAFKKPTSEELEHDFLWRVRPHAPSAGMIGVFDRSHYEDVLIARVRELAPAEEIERRYDAINAFEQELVDDDTTVIKVMLHIGTDEQKARLQERLDRPEKHWKFNPGDIDERLLTPKYREAYQLVFDRTATDAAPWYVIPADKKWFARIAVQQLLIDALRDMELSWPVADFDVEAEKARLAAS